MVTLTLDTRQQDLVDEVRAVARRALAPRATEYDRAAQFPTENFADLADAGLLGLLIPTSSADAAPTWSPTPARRRTRRSLRIDRPHLRHALRRDPAARRQRRPAARAVLQRVVDNGETDRLGLLRTRHRRQRPQPAARATLNDNGFTMEGTKAFCTGAGHVDHYLINTFAARASSAAASPCSCCPTTPSA